MRPVAALVLLLAWLAGLGTLGVAWAQDTVVVLSVEAKLQRWASWGSVEDVRYR